MVADDVANRLRALLALMREHGATKIVTPDGFTIERPPLSPLEAAVSVAPPTRAAASGGEKDEDLDEHDQELLEERELPKAWDALWLRMNRSSGAGVPPYPGHEKARQFIARWGQ